MTPADLSRLETLARDATPISQLRADYAVTDEILAFRAAANPAAVLALIERVRELEGKLEHMRNPRPEMWCEDAGRYDRGECRWPSCACKDKKGTTDG